MLRLSTGRTFMTVTLLILTFATVAPLRAYIHSQRSHTPRTMNIPKESFPKGVFEITKVNNLQAADFPRNFQLEIKNTSQKPIYYLEIDLVLPESRAYFPSPLILRMFFGSRSLINQDTYASPDDPCLKPNETLVLEPYGKTAEYLYKHLVDRGLQEIVTGKILLAPQMVNFGDGTCYINSRMYKAEKTKLILLKRSGLYKGFLESGQTIAWKPVTTKGMFDPCVLVQDKTG